MVDVLTLSLAAACAHALLHVYAIVMRLLTLERAKEKLVNAGVGGRCVSDDEVEEEVHAGGQDGMKDGDGKGLGKEEKAEEEVEKIEEEAGEAEVEARVPWTTVDAEVVYEQACTLEGPEKAEPQSDNESYQAPSVDIHDEKRSSTSTTDSKIKANTTLVSGVSVPLSSVVSNPFSQTSPTSPISPVPFVTPSTNYPAHGPYTGVGDKVADFVKKYKEMQAELAEAKERLEDAEGYKAKYEELKREMDDILGNA